VKLVRLQRKNRLLFQSALLTGINDGGWRSERQTAYSKRLKLTGSRGHVTVDAQNRPKLGCRRLCLFKITYNFFLLMTVCFIVLLCAECEFA
jgi:hypothetical protein